MYIFIFFVGPVIVKTSICNKLACPPGSGLVLRCRGPSSGPALGGQPTVIYLC